MNTTTELTREAVLAMPAGREMDALVAERVFGWRPSPDGDGWVIDAAGEFGIRVVRGDWSPSRSIGCAWAIMEGQADLEWDEDGKPMNGQRWYYDLHSMIAGGWRVNVYDESLAVETRGTKCRPEHLQGISADTAPLAICRAALLTTL